MATDQDTPVGRLRSSSPRTVLVEATDTGDTWTLAVSEDPVVTTRERASSPDTVVSGTAVQLYLGLWNRGEEISCDQEFLDEWRRSVTVRFS